MDKILFVYYSFTGNVEFIAEEFAKRCQCDLFRLETKAEVSKSSVLKYLWGGYQVLMKKAPELEKVNIDWEKYDVIIIGTPVWAWNFSPPVRTFFDNNKIINKKIGLICSHEGSPGKTFDRMKECLKDNEFMFQIDFFKPLQEQEKAKAQIDKMVEMIKM